MVNIKLWDGWNIVSYIYNWIVGVFSDEDQVSPEGGTLDLDNHISQSYQSSPPAPVWDQWPHGQCRPADTCHTCTQTRDTWDWWPALDQDTTQMFQHHDLIWWSQSAPGVVMRDQCTGKCWDESPALCCPHTWDRSRWSTSQSSVTLRDD